MVCANEPCFTIAFGGESVFLVLLTRGCLAGASLQFLSQSRQTSALGVDYRVGSQVVCESDSVSGMLEGDRLVWRTRLVVHTRSGDIEV
ncbi:hypothetical protein Poly59_59900 [Rubripirellula reticaptiva]|uniref:Uncharacterized protein n=1 Tax=Rubripirellula reticaptiva TaxID=2528013 RepID=A0A5C6EHC8_9BACT|nr:hypothetical protein Poly59_59900 [Rubripirellula reticaptiva]